MVLHMPNPDCRRKLTWAGNSAHITLRDPPPLYVEASLRFCVVGPELLCCQKSEALLLARDKASTWWPKLCPAATRMSFPVAIYEQATAPPKGNEEFLFHTKWLNRA